MYRFTPAGTLRPLAHGDLTASEHLSVTARSGAETARTESPGRRARTGPDRKNVVGNQGGGVRNLSVPAKMG